MSTDKCAVQVSEPPGYWHSHPCTFKPKFTLVTHETWREAYGDEVRVCGVHRKMYPFVHFSEAGGQP